MVNGTPQRHITLNYLDCLGNFSSLMCDDNPLCGLSVLLHTPSVYNFGVVFRNFLHFNSIRNIKHNNVFALAFPIHFRSDQCFSTCTNRSDPVQNVKVFALHKNVLPTVSHYKSFRSINIGCCAQHFFNPGVLLTTTAKRRCWREVGKKRAWRTIVYFRRVSAFSFHRSSDINFSEKAVVTSGRHCDICNHKIWWWWMSQVVEVAMLLSESESVHNRSTHTGALAGWTPGHVNRLTSLANQNNHLLV